MALTESRCHRRHAFAFVAIVELQWGTQMGVGAGAEVEREDSLSGVGTRTETWCALQQKAGGNGKR